jgi:hypothetical protein
VFTARYALSHYIKHIRFIFKGLITVNSPCQLLSLARRRMGHENENGVLILVLHAAAGCVAF